MYILEPKSLGLEEVPGGIGPALAGGRCPQSFGARSAPPGATLLAAPWDRFSSRSCSTP